MAVSSAMRRLLRIRNLTEDQSRMDLESALGELHVIERALEASQARERLGRRWIGQSVQTGEIADRASALEEASAAARHRVSLMPRIAESRDDVNELRLEFLTRRTERRQAETLIEQAEARDAIEMDRRAQQALDDLHLSRRERGNGVRDAQVHIAGDASALHQRP